MRTKRIEWDGTGAAAAAAGLRELAASEPVTDDVRAIIEQVERDGDAGVRSVAEQLGDPAPESLRVDPEAVAAAPGLLEPEVRDALRAAAANIAAVSRAELESLLRPVAAELEQGQRVEVRNEPVGAAGVYAPGGKAPYPSSVLMCCVPARVAGVGRVAVASPPGESGRPDASVLAAASIAGVDEVYAIGGAQAIAALGLGTDSVAAVDVIAGPGNRYVTEAKRLITARAGIDGVAGPTELMIVADPSADPRQLALDLLAQAEHGPDGVLALVSPSSALLEGVGELVGELAAKRPSVADAPLALVGSPGIQASLDLADAFAPEHLELVFEGADESAARSRIAGCVFVGSGGAAAFGDYAAGSNHVLPTGGAARFGGPLGPGAFMRRTSVVAISRSAAAALAPTVGTLARAEGFPVHAESAAARAGETPSEWEPG